MTLLFGASSVLTELRDALNTIWRVPVNRSRTHLGTVWRLGKERVYSFLMILCLGVLLLASLVLNTWIGAIETSFGLRRLASGYLVHLGTFMISYLIIAFVFAAIYKFIPKVRLNWREVAVGGTVTSLLFIIGKQMIAVYMARTNLGSAYGAAGSLLVVLAWVYYSAQVFFFGAEFTKVYAEAFGSQKERRPSEHASGQNRIGVEIGATVSITTDEAQRSRACRIGEVTTGETFYARENIYRRPETHEPGRRPANAATPGTDQNSPIWTFNCRQTITARTLPKSSW